MSLRVKAGWLMAVVLMAGVEGAQAAPVVVDPQGYQGYWKVSGMANWVQGPATVAVATGTATVNVGLHGFQISVAADGSVTSLNPQAAIGGAGSLTFQNATVQIDPGAYSHPGASWAILYVTGWGAGYVSGTRTLTLVPNLFYAFNIGGYGTGNLKVLLDASGSFQPLVASGVDSSHAFLFNGSTLEFRTAPVTFVPGGYVGDYSLQQASGARPVTVHLVTGHRYFLWVGPVGPGDGKYIDVDAAGNVLPVETALTVPYAGTTTSPASNALTFAGGTITFKNVGISVDPAGYAKYSVSVVHPTWVTGPQAFTVVPDLRYIISSSNTQSHHVFVDVNGHTQARNVGGWDSAKSFDFNGSTITFRTRPISIDPGSHAGLYTVDTAVAWSTGPTQRPFLLGARYRLSLLGVATPATFDIDSPCAVLPSETVVLGTGPGAVSLSVKCPQVIVDGDGDGVADTSDNCPADANADQLDLDNDGAGDVCDSDADGDGVANGSDNCTASANAGQADLDGDGTGDACDADADGDAVSDGADNCPMVPNVGQEDGDLDSIGDACDPDDDGDGAIDTTDNCPTVANPGQADFDADGAGNACDGDADGDGVGNVADACGETPGGAAVTDEGCSPSQFVALGCSPTAFPNHGRYVACVAHVAQVLEAAGLIDSSEKGRLVSQAAKSK